MRMIHTAIFFIAIYLKNEFGMIKQTTVNRYAIQWKAGQLIDLFYKLSANQLFALLHLFL